MSVDKLLTTELCYDIVFLITTKNKRYVNMAELAEKQVKRLRALIDEAETNVSAAKELLISLLGEDPDENTGPVEDVVGKVVEGIFDGQAMLGPDGKVNPVPANYASKSKLVQGDLMKLTIGDGGQRLYKQIGPIPRKTVIGTLRQTNHQYFIDVDGREYRVLLASVTYFKLKVGDQVSVIIPENDEDVEWAAVEAAL